MFKEEGNLGMFPMNFMFHTLSWKFEPVGSA
jgi:hypothetical protein